MIFSKDKHLFYLLFRFCWSVYLNPLDNSVEPKIYQQIPKRLIKNPDGY